MEDAWRQHMVALSGCAGASVPGQPPPEGHVFSSVFLGQNIHGPEWVSTMTGTLGMT